MMSCKDITHHASRFLDGPTTLRQRAGFRLHLFMCKNCSRFVRQFTLMVAATGKMPPADEPSDADVEALLAKLKNPPSDD